MLVLTDKNVKELEAVMGELPTKFGIPLINLFRKFADESQSGVKISEPTAEAVETVEAE